MSDALMGTIITAVVASVPPCLIAYLAFVQARRSAEIANAAKNAVVENTVITTDTKAAVTANTAAVVEIGLKVDGRFDKLVEDIRSVARQEGRAEGVAATEASAEAVRARMAQSQADHAEGLAEGRAEPRAPAAGGV